MSSENANLQLSIEAQADASDLDNMIEKCNELTAAQERLAQSSQATSSAFNPTSTGLASGQDSLSGLGQSYQDITEKSNEASGAISQFNGNMTTVSGGVQDATKNFGDYSMAAGKSSDATNAMGMSAKQTMGAFTGLGGGIMGIVGSLMGLERAGIMVDRAQKMVATSTEAARKAANDYNDALSLQNDYTGEVARRATTLAAANAEVARLQKAGAMNTQEYSKALQDQRAAQTSYNEAIKGGIPDAEKVTQLQSKMETTAMGASYAQERLGMATQNQAATWAEATMTMVGSIAAIGGSVAQMGTAIPAAISGARAGFADLSNYMGASKTAASEAAPAMNDASTAIEKIGPSAAGSSLQLANLGPAAIAAAVGIGTFLALEGAYQTNFMGFQKTTRDMSQGINDFIGAWDIAVRKLGEGDIAGAFMTMQVAFDDALTNILTAADNLLGNLPSKIGGYIGGAVTQGAIALAGLDKAMTEGFGNMLKAADTALGGFPSKVAGWIGAAASQAGTAAAGLGKSILQGISGITTTALNFDAWVTGGISKAATSAATAAANLGKVIYNGITNVTNTAIDFSKWILGGLSSALAPAAAVALSIGQAIYANVLAPLGKLGEALGNAMTPKNTATQGTGPSGGVAESNYEKNLEQAERDKTLTNNYAEFLRKQQAKPPVDTSKLPVGSAGRPYPDTVPQAYTGGGGGYQQMAYIIPEGLREAPGLYRQVADAQEGAAVSTQKMVNVQVAQADEFAKNKNWLDQMSSGLNTFNEGQKTSVQSANDFATGSQGVDVALTKQEQSTRQAYGALQRMDEAAVKARAENAAYSEGLVKSEAAMGNISVQNAAYQGQLMGTSLRLQEAGVQQDLFKQGVLKSQLAQQQQVQDLIIAAGAYQNMSNSIESTKGQQLAFAQGALKQSQALVDQKVAIQQANGELTIYAQQVASGAALSAGYTLGKQAEARAILDAGVAVANETGKMEILNGALQGGYYQTVLLASGVNKANKEMLDMEAGLITTSGYLQQLALWYDSARGKADIFTAGMRDMQQKTLETEIALLKQGGAIKQYEAYMANGVVQHQAFVKGMLDMRMQLDQNLGKLLEVAGATMQYGMYLSDVENQQTLFASGEAQIRMEQQETIASTIKLAGSVLELDRQLRDGSRMAQEWGKGLLTGREEVQKLELEVAKQQGEWEGFNAAITNVIEKVAGPLPEGLRATNEQLKELYEVAASAPAALEKLTSEMNKLADSVLGGLVKGLEGGGKGKNKKDFNKALQDLAKETDLTFSPEVKLDLKAGAQLAQLHDQIEKGLGVVLISIGFGDTQGAMGTIDQMIGNIQSKIATIQSSDFGGGAAQAAAARYQPLIDTLAKVREDIGAGLGPGMAKFNTDWTEMQIALANSNQTVSAFDTNLQTMANAVKTAQDPVSALDRIMQQLGMSVNASGDIVSKTGMKIESLADFYRSMGDTVKQNGDVFDQNGIKITNIGQQAGDATDPLNTMADTFIALGQAMEGALLRMPDFFGTQFAAAATSANQNLGTLVDVFTALMQSINDTLGRMPGYFGEQFGAAANAANQAIGPIADNFTIITQAVNDLLGRMPGYFGQQFGAAADAANTAIAGVATGVNAAFSRAEGDANGYLNSIASAATSSFSKAGSAANTAAVGVNNAFRKAEGDARGYLNSIVSASGTAFSNVASAASTHLSAIPGMFGKITSSANTAAAAVNKVASAINALHDKTVTVTVNTNYTGGTQYAAEGFEGVVSTPTKFMVGERGPEMVRVEPLTGSSASLNKASGTNEKGGTKQKVEVSIKQPLQVVMVSQMNGKEIARQLASYELDISAEL